MGLNRELTNVGFFLTEGPRCTAADTSAARLVLTRVCDLSRYLSITLVIGCPCFDYIEVPSYVTN